MRIRLAMQPFWVRALVYGVAFGAFFGLYTSFSSPPRVLSTVTATLVAGVAFGLLMAYQGQSLYNDMTAAVAGLDATGRSQAIATVTDGGVPTDSAVRNSALRLGRTHLGLRSDAQLSRREWRTWLMLPVFGGLAVLMATTSSTKCEAEFAVALGLFWVIFVPLEVVRQRRIKRNLNTLLSEGPASR